MDYALQCLRDFTTQEYENIQYYFQQICELTAMCAKHPDPKVGAQAYEYWTTLVEDETERTVKGVTCLGYIQSCSDSLIALILEGLCIINFEEDEGDDDDWGHALSAACCLQKLAVLIKNDVVDKVVGFAAQNLQVQLSWQQKYSALVALGSITEGPEKQKFTSIIIDALPNLFVMAKERSSKVRQALAYVLLRICEHHPDVVCSPQVFHQFIGAIKDGIQDKPRVSNLCCAAIDKLAPATQPLNEETENCLSPYYQDLL